MSKKELKAFLNELSAEELRAEIIKLYERFTPVQDYYRMELTSDTSEILNDYKARIEKEYFPSRGFGKARSSETRKIEIEFKKIAVFKKDVIELILFKVEIMIQYSIEYGDINEPFYITLEKSYENACKMIHDEKLLSFFKGKCHKLLNLTYNFGWGVHENMKDNYYNWINK